MNVVETGNTSAELPNQPSGNLTHSRIKITSEIIQTQNNLRHDLTNKVIRIPSRDGTDFNTIQISDCELEVPKTSYGSMFLEQLQNHSPGTMIIPLKLFYKASSIPTVSIPILAPISSSATPIIAQYSPASFTCSPGSKYDKPDRIPNSFKSVYDAPKLPSSWVKLNNNENNRFVSQKICGNTSASDVSSSLLYHEASANNMDTFISPPLNKTEINIKGEDNSISKPLTTTFKMAAFEIPSKYKLHFKDKEALRVQPGKKSKNFNNLTVSLKDQNKLYSYPKNGVAKLSANRTKSKKNLKTENGSSSGSERRGMTKMCGPRSKSGCWTCRLRRKRCPEQRPVCGECVRLGLECDGYGDERPDFMKDEALAKEKMESIKAVTKFIKKRKKNEEYLNDKQSGDTDT